MTSVVLAGLEAHNPLGFMAALGLLRVLDHEALRVGREPPRLAFVDEGAFIARLVTSHTLEEIISIVLRDAAAQADNRALQLAYDTEGALVAPSLRDATRDLKPSPEGARELLEYSATADPRTAALAAAWFSELVQDNTKGRTKPTAFHFTAGQQAFLGMVEALRVGLGANHLREALEGPWLNTSQLPSLRWDASVTRLYAFRAKNPSDEKQGSVPGANWLAVQGLAFFPVAARGGRLVTTCVTGGWKDSTFTWPVWSPPAEVTSIVSLLRLDAATWTQRERSAYGIESVFRSRIVRSDYGSFAPAVVIPPATENPRIAPRLDGARAPRPRQ
jgi:hypothetical protein